MSSNDAGAVGYILPPNSTCVFSLLLTGPTPKSAVHRADPGQYLPEFVSPVSALRLLHLLFREHLHILTLWLINAGQAPRAILLVC